MKTVAAARDESLDPIVSKLRRGGRRGGRRGSFTYCDEGGVPLRRHPISIKGTGGGKKMLKEQNKTKKNKKQQQ